MIYNREFIISSTPVTKIRIKKISYPHLFKPFRERIHPKYKQRLIIAFHLKKFRDWWRSTKTPWLKILLFDNIEAPFIYGYWLHYFCFWDCYYHLFSTNIVKKMTMKNISRWWVEAEWMNFEIIILLFIKIKHLNGKIKDTLFWVRYSNSHVDISLNWLISIAWSAISK